MIERWTIRCCLLLLLCGCGEAPEPAARPERPERIVSMAPNITETLFALGLGDRVSGVTSACTYPEAARTLPRIGGFGQFSDEAIVRLNPDLVILHREHEAEKRRLASLGIPYLETGSFSVAGILQTIRTIGSACGAEPAAERLVSEINRRMKALETAASGRPTVLMTFGGRADGSGPIHAFGAACLHTELLEIAGGNPIVKAEKPFVLLSKETVLRLDPDRIIELAPDGSPRAWNQWPELRAVRNGNVDTLTNDYALIPGPRFILLLEELHTLMGATP